MWDGETALNCELSAVNKGGFMSKVIQYQKCRCGAVTLFFDNGADSPMYQETLEMVVKEFGIDLSQVEELPQSCCCNHCVNHWGIDLCECGSGCKVGECDCGSHKAHHEFGVKFDSFGAIIRAFGNYLK